MIRATRLIEHRFTLTAPLRSAAGSWQERSSLLLVVEDGNGVFGIGEAAALPGFSRDALDEARAELSLLLGRSLRERPCGDVARALAESSAAVASPAARCALEAALLDVWSRRSRQPAWSLLAEADSSAVALSAWLPDGTHAALDAAKDAEQRGINAFKVKLDARRGLEDGVQTLEALRAELGPAVRLRGDANRSARRAELAPYLARLRALELEWLEEPTPEPLEESLGVPIALDESLEPNGAAPELTARPFVAALVLKPTSLGGLTRCLELAAHARAAGRGAVASHALEGPVGYMTAAALAVTLGDGHAHGLAPHRALRNTRPPALAPERDVIVPWTAAGFGLDVDQALAGASIVSEQRA